MLVLAAVGVLYHQGAQSDSFASVRRPGPIIWVSQPWPDRPDPVGRIASHRWWTQKPTQQQVEEWLAQITELEPGQALFLDNSGKASLGRGDIVNGVVVLSGYEHLNVRCIGFYQEVGALRRFADCDLAQQFLLRLDNADY
jgi:hypothetical protein